MEIIFELNLKVDLTIWRTSKNFMLIFNFVPNPRVVIFLHVKMVQSMCAFDYVCFFWYHI